MASAALIDDRLQIDGVNMYTATDTFGVPTGGFYKDYINGAYFTGIDENAVDYSTCESADQLQSVSGNMYLKTTGSSPAPHPMFPARKYDYVDGTTNWYRPGLASNAVRQSCPIWWIIALLMVFVLLIYKFK